MNTPQKIHADEDGFLVSKTFDELEPEADPLGRLSEDVRAIRKFFEQRRKEGDGAKAAQKAATVSTPGPKTATVVALPNIQRAVGSLPAAATPATPQDVAHPKPAPVVARIETTALRDAMGRFVGQAVATPKPKDVQGRTDKDVQGRTENAADQGKASDRDAKGRFTGTVEDREKDDGTVSKLLGDIKNGIQGIASVGGDAGEVDPSVKAAQEVAGIAGAAVNGVKAVGTIAAPIGRGLAGMLPGKANDAPTPWFRRFFGELRGLRREESVFNKAQLRTLKEIEAKPSEGKGSGVMGMLMMLVGPLIAAIGAAITAGFALLMKLPGFSLLAKLATSLMPATLMPKRPITQPTAAPVAPGAQTKASPTKTATPAMDAKTGQPIPETAGGSKAAGEAAAKKPGLLARAGKGVGGALKRVPLLGTLLAGLSIGTDVYASETDDNTTRAEKDKQTGKAIGGGGGAIAGMMAGGAAGASLGMLAGPVGAAIGGVVGSVAGGFFGEKAGAIVGETIGGWVTDIRNADIPGTISKGWTRTTAAMQTAWTDSTQWFKIQWGASLSLFGGIWEKAKSVFDALGAGLDKFFAKFGIDLPGARKKAAELATAATEKTKEVAGAVKETAVKGATAAVEYGKDKAGQVGEALTNSAMGRGVSYLFSGGKRRAAETAQAYSAGNISGLDDAHTRALVASTALTESGGGKLDAENKQGYMGRYQAGASWLSSAGLMRGGDKAVKAAMKADGFNNEWKWAESGGMTRYLSNDANWVDGMSRSKYLASATVQDTAFKTNSDKTHADLVKRGVIKSGDTQETVAGYLKAAHLAGAGGAIAVSKGGQGASDANGTSARKYFDDVAKDKDGFVQAFRGAGVPTQVAGVNPSVVTASAAKPPTMPNAPTIPDIPATPSAGQTLQPASGDKKPQVVVVNNKGPVGRDLSDRRAAHIVTGGLSGGGQG